MKYQLIAKWSEETGYEEVEPVRNTREEAEKDLENLFSSIKAGGTLPVIGWYINER